MIVTIVLEKEDFAVLHDAVYDITGYSFTDEQLQTIWDKLPEDIQHEAVRWGTSDTCVREEIHKYLDEEVKKAEEDLKK